MSEIAVISRMNEEMLEELPKAAQRSRGQAVKVKMLEVKENESKRGRTA